MRPPLVEAAVSLSRDLGFEKSCEDDVGRLLGALAATLPEGAVAGEVGTGCGAGSAWILSGLTEGARLVTVESDPVRAAAAARLLAERSNATVVHGEWIEIFGSGPFSLLFVDAKPAKAKPEMVVRMIAPGGVVVLDDLPGRWPDQREADDVRRFWLSHPDFASAEVGIDYGPAGYPGAAIVAVRRR